MTYTEGAPVVYRSSGRGHCFGCSLLTQTLPGTHFTFTSVTGPYPALIKLSGGSQFRRVVGPAVAPPSVPISPFVWATSVMVGVPATLPTDAQVTIIHMSSMDVESFWQPIQSEDSRPNWGLGVAKVGAQIAIAAGPVGASPETLYLSRLATCPDGYRPTTMIHCSECSAGHWSVAGDASCTPAEMGYMVDDGDKSQQIPCQGGQYQPATQANSCETCGVGTNTPADGLPHTTCDSWSPPAALPADGALTTGPVANMPHAPVSAMFDGTAAHTEVIDGRLVIVPIVTAATVPAGTYPVQVNLAAGAPATFTVTMPEITPTPIVALTSTGARAEYSGVVCPSSAWLGALQTESLSTRTVTHASGVYQAHCSTAIIPVTAATIKSSFSPVLSAGGVAPSAISDTELCITLNATVTDATGFGVLVDGAAATTHLTNGAVCVWVDYDFDRTVVATINDDPFLEDVVVPAPAPTDTPWALIGLVSTLGFVGMSCIGLIGLFITASICLVCVAGIGWGLSLRRPKGTAPKATPAPPLDNAALRDMLTLKPVLPSEGSSSSSAPTVTETQPQPQPRPMAVLPHRPTGVTLPGPGPTSPISPPSGQQRSLPPLGLVRPTPSVLSPAGRPTLNRLTLPVSPPKRD